jgi:RimJ/RimL family protein N-acetyltransferase
MNTKPSFTDSLPRHTNRIVLRQLTKTDLASFQAYRGDLEVGRYQSWSVQTVDEAAQFLESMSAAALGAPGEWLQIGIAEHPGTRLIGDVGIVIQDDLTTAQIGITLAAHAQGRGLAAEAARAVFKLLFETTSVARIVAVCDAKNVRSLALWKHLGMTISATLDAEFRGEPCQEVVFVHERAAETGPAVPAAPEPVQATISQPAQP